MTAAPRLRLCASEGLAVAPAETPRPEHLSEREYQAIWTLSEAGALPPDAAATRWAGNPAPRWTRAHDLGLALWTLAALGTWSLLS